MKNNTTEMSPTPVTKPVASLGQTYASVDKHLNLILAVDKYYSEIWDLISNDGSTSKKIKEAVKGKLEEAGQYVGRHVEDITHRMNVIKNENIEALEKSTSEIRKMIHEAACSKPTYSNVVSSRTINNRKPPNGETLVISSENTDETFKMIKEKIVPEEHNLRVLGHYKPNEKTMLINLADKQQRDKMRNLISELQIQGTEVKNSEKLLPTIKMENVENITAEKLQETLISITGNAPNKVDIITTRNNKKIAFVRLCKDDYYSLINSSPDYIYCSYYRIKYRLIVSVRKCNICFGMGHSGSRCRYNVDSNRLTVSMKETLEVSKKAHNEKKCTNCTVELYCEKRLQGNLNNDEASAFALDFVKHSCFDRNKCAVFKRLYDKEYSRYDF